MALQFKRKGLAADTYHYANVPQALYDAWSIARWEGSVELNPAAAGATQTDLAMGTKVNLSSGPAAWAFRPVARNDRIFCRWRRKIRTSSGSRC